MKLFLPLLLIFLIANLMSITNSSSINIKLSCEVSSSSESDKNDYDVICMLPDGLNKDSLTEVSDVDVKDEKFLKTTSLRFNSTRIPGSMPNSTRMPDSMPTKIGRKFKHLEKFEISVTKLKYINQNDFEGMEGLKVLDLSSNDIEFVSPDALNKLTNLEVIFLYDNEITSFSDHLLRKLPNLREFHADRNKIERLHANFFGNNPAIEKISLNDNKLITISENFTSYKHLTYVDLRRNFEHCTACEIMSSSKATKRFNECEVDKFNSEQKMRQDYLDCAKGELTKMDNYTKIYAACEEVKIQKFKDTKAAFDKCSNIKNFPITLQKIKDVENCFVNRVRDEKEALKNLELCIDNAAAKDKKILDMLGQCSVKKIQEAQKNEAAYGSCMFCKKIDEADALKKCEVRYVKNYDDNLIEFEKDVAKFFGRR